MKQQLHTELHISVCLFIWFSYLFVLMFKAMAFRVQTMLISHNDKSASEILIPICFKITTNILEDKMVNLNHVCIHLVWRPLKIFAILLTMLVT